VDERPGRFALYALNMSAIHNADDPAQVHRYGAILLQLVSDVRKVWSGATLKVFDNVAPKLNTSAHFATLCGSPLTDSV